jgi:hypothetical protein
MPECSPGGPINREADLVFSNTVACNRYDKDGNTAAFSVTEMSDIVAVWRAVAEDYAPFDVDVTTIPPPSSTSMQYISHVCIGGDGTGTGFSSSGGVAYLGVYGQTYNAQYQPAFVFSKNLGPSESRTLVTSTECAMSEPTWLHIHSNAITALQILCAVLQL